MITRKTVLVLGAGASMPFGFPSGTDLVKHICTKLDLEQLHAIIEAMHINYHDPLYYEGRFSEFTSALSKSGMLSIDAFLQHNEHYMKEGKLAIAATLIPHEEESRLFDFDTNWYKTLFQHLNSPFNDFQNNRLSVITFNYDRSLEWFLVTALMNVNKSRSLKECKEKVDNIPIVHLHGLLGDLPNDTGDTSPTARGYRPEIDRHQVWRASQKIRVIHEDISADPVFKKAKALLRDAEIIAFLGFGYDLTNLRRLGLCSMANKLLLENNRMYADPENRRYNWFGTVSGLGKAKTKWVDSYMRSQVKLVDTKIDAILADEQILQHEMNTNEILEELRFS